MQAILGFLLALLSLVAAQASNSSVFVFDGEDGTSIVFACQADKATGDLYFHISAPAGNQWVGIGTGYKMADSLMLIAYADGSDNGITLSGRYSTGNTEPEYRSDIDVQAQGVNTIATNGWTKNIIANGVCKGCVSWQGKTIVDLGSSAQAFIFAVGPAFPPLSSSSKSAGLTEHSFVGRFTMDMTAATVQSGGSVPAGPFDTRLNSDAATNTKSTNDPAPHIHGLVMSVVFVLLLPFGSLILRVWNTVKYHAVVQIIALVLFCMAAAGGVVVSTKYNRSKNFTSAHQIIGFFLLIAFLSQAVLGILHHRIYKREGRKTIKGWIHLYMGPAIILFGLINGILGFALAGRSTHPSSSIQRKANTPLENVFIAIPYCIIILFVGIVYTCIRVFSARRKKRNQASKGQQGLEGYQYPQFAQNPPPNYSEFDAQSGHSQGAYRMQDVPLDTYHSGHSAPHVGMPAQEPRQML